MKQYKLKKDLPTFKAGEIFDISSNGNLVKRGECISDCVVAYSTATLEKFPNILTDWFEEIPEGPRTVWDLKEGDACYVIGNTTDEVYGYSTKFEKCYEPERSIGDIFLTMEECEKELARCKAKQILLRDTRGFKPDWNDRYSKYEVYYDYIFDKLGTECCNAYCSHSDLWFASREDALASIEAHPDEWKTYLGVEE